MKTKLSLITRAGALLLAGAPLSVFAADAGEPGGNAPDLLLASLKMIGGAALVIGLLLLTAHLIRKYGPGRILALSDRDAIKIIATKPIGPRKYITLVQIGNNILTLGVTETSITRLDKTGADEFRPAHDLKTPDPRDRKSVV